MYRNGLWQSGLHGGKLYQSLWDVVQADEDQNPVWERRGLMDVVDCDAETIWVSGNDVGDGGGGAGNGGGDDVAPQIPAQVSDERGVDQGAPGGSRERADAPDDVHGSGTAQVV